MIKKISLNKKNGRINKSYIILPSKILKQLNWINDDIHLRYENEELVISNIVNKNKNIDIKNGKLIAFNKNSKIIKGKKFYKDKIYITEKVYLPMEITKELTTNFENLQIIIKIENNNIIIIPINL